MKTAPITPRPVLMRDVDSEPLDPRQQLMNLANNPNLTSQQIRNLCQRGYSEEFRNKKASAVRLAVGESWEALGFHNLRPGEPARIQVTQTGIVSPCDARQPERRLPPLVRVRAQIRRERP